MSTRLTRSTKIKLLMTHLKLLLFASILLCCNIAFSQEHTITGKVTDEKQVPVAGATVKIKGTSTATSTNSEGSFTLKARSTTVTLIISSIGFSSKEVVVGEGSGEVSISLTSDSKQLGEVVVTALGIQRQQKSLVYATQSIKPQQLTEVRDANNVLNSLQGKVANALIIQGSGGLGSGAKIVLRGNKSIQGNNNALLVVDGVPITNNTYSTAGNDFGSLQSSDGAGDINPDDIESMNVLRGASAAALYGSQAANGVLVIATKKGRKGDVNVTVNSGIGFEKPFSLPEFQNTYGQGISGKLADSSQQGASWGPRMTGQSYTDYLYKQSTLNPQPNNVKDVFQTGLNLTNYIGLSAGGDKTQSYLSYTNNYAKGIIRQNEMNKHTVTYRITSQLSKKLSSDAKITYINQAIKGRPRAGEENSPVFDAYEMPRSVSTAQARQFQTFNTFATPVPTNWPSTNNSIYQNPYWMIYNTNITEDRNRIIGFLSLKYQLTPWLAIRGNVNLDRSTSRIQERYQQGTLLWNTNAGGSYGIADVVYQQKWYDVYLEGSNKLGADMKIDYHVGTLYQDNQATVNVASSNGLNVINKFDLNYATNPTTTSSGSEVQVQALFGQANFSWKDAIYVDGTVRTDWNSTVRQPYRIVYPSVGVSAVLSELIKDMPQSISFLKVSANYAKVGNGGTFGVRFPSFTFYPGAGNGNIGRTPTVPIPGLEPEMTTSTELGLEARFINDRIGFNLTYYHTNSKNQLLQISLPVATGYSLQYINAGNIENHGLELVVNGTPIKNRDFSWETQLNLSLNRNKVIKLSDELKQTDLGGADQRSAQPRVKEGGSYGDLYAHRWLKNDKGQYLVDTAGAPFTSYTSGDPIGYIGNFNPRYNVGWTNTIQYKGFSLRFLIDGRIGGTLVSGTEMNLAFSGITKATEKFREGGMDMGGVDASGSAVNKTITAQKFWTTVSGQRYGVGEFFAYNATAIRMREVSLGFDIPLHIDFVKSLRISAVARNLFWIYRGKSILSIPGLGKRTMWMDPDISNGNGVFQGTEYGAIPTTRTLGFNIKATF